MDRRITQLNIFFYKFFFSHNNLLLVSVIGTKHRLHLPSYCKECYFFFRVILVKRRRRVSHTCKDSLVRFFFALGSIWDPLMERRIGHLKKKKDTPKKKKDTPQKNGTQWDHKSLQHVHFLRFVINYI